MDAFNQANSLCFRYNILFDVNPSCDMIHISHLDSHMEMWD